jgi:LmbE family N-acetylglucosaminyl deacetylase
MRNGVEVARVRRREQHEALERLGVPRHAIRRLEFEDGRVAEEESLLADVLERLIDGYDAGGVVAPWIHDHHTDHEACGRAAATACRRTGAMLAGGLFWAYHFTDPEIAAAASLGRFELTSDEHAAKQEALACHHSQIDDPACGTVLSRRELAPARWRNEYFVLDQLPPTPPERSRQRHATISGGFEHSPDRVE